MSLNEENSHLHNLQVINKGLVDYLITWNEMKAFTLNRDQSSSDQIWLLQHPPTYTLGRAAKPSNFLKSTNIPIHHIDRGGDITYHAPGQFIAYFLIDLKRAKLGIKSLVYKIEESIVNYLKTLGIQAYRIEKRPGVYCINGKIAALGLAVKKYGTYHGLSLNVDMNLDPFNHINPCGIKQKITQIASYNNTISIEQVSKNWCKEFTKLFNKYRI